MYNSSSSILYKDINSKKNIILREIDKKEIIESFCDKELNTENRFIKNKKKTKIIALLFGFICNFCFTIIYLNRIEIIIQIIINLDKVILSVTKKIILSSNVAIINKWIPIITGFKKLKNKDKNIDIAIKLWFSK